jgi:hypothetical protein
MFSQAIEDCPFFQMVSLKRFVLLVSKTMPFSKTKVLKQFGPVKILFHMEQAPEPFPGWLDSGVSAAV